MTMRWNEEAEEVLGLDLYEALDTIRDLRAALQLAHFERGALTKKEVNKTLADAARVLRKHDMSDDMMDARDGRD